MQFSEQLNASQKNLSYLLAEKLGQQILSGKYPPESILPGEIELAEQFGVSRTAVREAVKMLAAKGMVLPRPRIGTRVMPVISWNFLDHDFIKWWLSSGDHRQVLTYFRELRAAIEPQACALAAMNAGKDQKQSLSFLLKEMTLLSAHFERDKWITVDHRFHHLIYQACGNPFFSSFANLFNFVYHNFFESITTNQVIEIDLHKEIVDAIIDGNGERARQACQVLLSKV